MVVAQFEPGGETGGGGGTTNRVVVPARQAGNRFLLGSLKGLQIRA
jgi:hypothetical protein